MFFKGDNWEIKIQDDIKITINWNKVGNMFLKLLLELLTVVYM